MRSTLRRTWAEVSLDAIEHNYKALRARIGENVKFLGVVKADAYGHGAVHVARTLQELGADYLAVSSLDEAMELRANGIVMPILILGHTPTEQVPNLIANNITQTVTCLAKAHEYNAAAAAFGAKLRVHIKVDTGMSRLGVLCAQVQPGGLGCEFGAAQRAGSDLDLHKNLPFFFLTPLYRFAAGHGSVVFFYGVFYLSAFCWKPVFDRNCGETPRYFRQENSGEFVPQNVGLRMIDAPECAKESGDFSPGNRLEMLKNYERIRPIFWENFRRKRPKSF